MRNVTKAVIAGAAGVALLAGGAGSLAFWTDTKTGSSIAISSGDLSLGTITDSTGWTIEQNAAGVPVPQTAAVAYVPGTTLVVPGDVLTKTVAVPVNISGLDNKATLVVTGATTPSNALSSQLTAVVTSVNGVAGSTASLTSADDGTVNVVFTVTIPWTTDNTAKVLTTNFQATYTLTQVSAA
ncbi:MAG TPA: alternate-type signal peptide domain-containing protein [Galbitalea sp.]|jgi:alternate signal-mediated exported protein|nr:alternate-type signal peptide domain-containing protein [Galbitalea sp.]